MSAPQYVPQDLGDRPRRGEPLPPAGRWVADRPAEVDVRQPKGDFMGSQGPDQGYAMKLVHLFTDQLHVTPDEDRHDIEAGILGVALKRASLFGRAPVRHDLEVAFRVFGFLDATAPVELVRARTALFKGAGHSYSQRRRVADAVPEATLRLPHGVAAERHQASWADMLDLG